MPFVHSPIVTLRVDQTGKIFSLLLWHLSLGTTALYNTIVALNPFDMYQPHWSEQTEDSNNLTAFTDWVRNSNNFAFNPSLPIFVDAANGDYRLLPNSQAIDAGLTHGFHLVSQQTL